VWNYTLCFLFIELKSIDGKVYESIIFSNYSAIKKNASQVPVARAFNPSYSGGWEQKDHSLRPAQANSLRDSISKVLNTIAQLVECLPSKHEALSSKNRTVKTRYEWIKKMGYIYIYTHIYICIYIYTQWSIIQW
jgi:hypothetical protein